MPYLVKNKKPHKCKLPMPYDGLRPYMIGNLWKCRKCKKVWEVADLTPTSRWYDIAWREAK